MTAGRDSRGLESALRKHYALVNWSINLLTFYSLAVSLLIRQTREELARQPDLHHRVVFLQPPPSFDGGARAEIDACSILWCQSSLKMQRASYIFWEQSARRLSVVREKHYCLCRAIKKPNN